VAARRTLADASEQMRKLREEQAEKAAGAEPKSKVTLMLPRSVYQEAKSVVLRSVLDGGEPSTMSALVTEAIRVKLEELRAERNNGKPFPPVKGKLPPGPNAK